MLKRLRIHNFRSYLNAEIEFGQRHLLIGKNNSGKTNLCFALRFLGRTASEALAQAVGASVPGGIPELTNFAFKSKQLDLSIECALRYGDQELDYRYDLSLECSGSAPGAVAGTVGIRVVKERLVVSGGKFADTPLLESDGREAHLLHEEQVGRADEPHTLKTLAPQDATMLSALHELETNRRAVLFRRFLQSWMYFALAPDGIRWGWSEAARSGAYYADGKHVAHAIYLLKNQDEQRYRRLLDRVKTVEEGLLAINFLVAPDQGVVPFVSLRGRGRASWVGLSDGTLRALALSHLIEAADAFGEVEGLSSPLMIIEEPENGVYAGHLRKLLEGFENCAPRAQFIFTSHSPYFIDLFGNDPASVTLLRREGETSVIHRLPPDTAPAPPDERMTLAEKYFAEIIR